MSPVSLEIMTETLGLACCCNVGGYRRPVQAIIVGANC